MDMNFGPPRMEIREPRASNARLARVRAQFARRGIYLRGSHWLVVSPGTWRLQLADGLVVRDSSSVKRLDMAVARLKGEILDAISIDGGTGATRFYFDLGAMLEVRRRRASENTELWSLNNPSRVVAIHSGGRYRSGSVKRSLETELPIGTPVLVAARNAKVRRAILGMLRHAAV